MSGEEKERSSQDDIRSPSNAVPSVLPTVNPAAERQAPQKGAVPPAVFVILWISLSSSVILYNKWILDKKKGNFRFPIILTTWHLLFATIATQVMARTTRLLDGRKTVKMTGRVYLRAIVPIGLFFSLSLICGNIAYLTLNVAFIQMLKATTPVAVLLAGWAMGADTPNTRLLFNVSFIVIGVIIASFGEIEFVAVGFMFQVAGIAFEAVRLVMVQKLLNGAEYKMDPLVSLYYFAPVCTVMNFCVAMVFEVHKITIADFQRLGFGILLSNAMIAFALNVSVVFLIGRTSSLVLTLCGVLKDILLIIASIFLDHAIVSLLQVFGYSIALAGLVHYKLGGDKLKDALRDARMAWADYGKRRPIQRKLVVIVAVISVITMFLFVGMSGNSYVAATAANADTIAKGYTSYFSAWFKDHVEKTKAKASSALKGPKETKSPKLF